ncbi:MAG: F0F1 ATP synthase subunit gamma [Roseibium sp.]
MENLARIEAQLENLNELGSLMGALRSMAASRAREAQDAFAGTRAYRKIIERAIAGVAPLVRNADAPDPSEECVLIVVTSENGFVGGFNSRIVEHAGQVRKAKERLLLIGRRGQITAQEHGLRADRSLSMAARAREVTSLARRVASDLSNARSARILSARYRPGANFEVGETQVLPLNTAMLAKDTPCEPPLHQLPPDRLLESLAREYLFAELAAALMESLASENGARLRTMDAASHNIEDRLEKLRRKERAARQEQTTADMLDVVTGAEAVKQG